MEEEEEEELSGLGAVNGRQLTGSEEGRLPLSWRLDEVLPCLTPFFSLHPAASDKVGWARQSPINYTSDDIFSLPAINSALFSSPWGLPKQDYSAVFCAAHPPPPMIRLPQVTLTLIGRGRCSGQGMSSRFQQQGFQLPATLSAIGVTCKLLY